MLETDQERYQQRLSQVKKLWLTDYCAKDYMKISSSFDNAV